MIGDQRGAGDRGSLEQPVDPRLAAAAHEGAVGGDTAAGQSSEHGDIPLGTSRQPCPDEDDDPSASFAIAMVMRKTTIVKDSDRRVTLVMLNIRNSSCSAYRRSNRPGGCEREEHLPAIHCPGLQRSSGHRAWSPSSTTHASATHADASFGAGVATSSG
jgi:hypothetical protein